MNLDTERILFAQTPDFSPRANKQNSRGFRNQGFLRVLKDRSPRHAQEPEHTPDFSPQVLDIIPWYACESQYIKKVEVDPAKVQSLVKTALARVVHVSSQKVNSENVSFVIEGYYEAVKELLSAILLSHGLRSSNHQCLISFFIKTYKQYEAEAHFIAHLSFLRNRLNYYGELIDKSFYEEHKVDIDKVIKLLQSLLIT